MKFKILLFLILAGSSIAPAVQAELQDQGLKSIMDIIDKAIGELAEQAAAESDPAVLEGALTNATATVVNLSRTLGNLSYSRLQCGQAEVLSEFTQRVQLMPEQSRDPMRDAFQEGFDKSKDETPLLSEDECERLTRSRVRTETVDDTNVVEDKSKSPSRCSERRRAGNRGSDLTRRSKVPAPARGRTFRSAGLQKTVLSGRESI